MSNDKLDHLRKQIRELLPFGDYYRDNFYVTSSGNFCTATMKAAIEVLGQERREARAGAQPESAVAPGRRRLERA